MKLPTRARYFLIPILVLCSIGSLTTINNVTKDIMSKNSPVIDDKKNPFLNNGIQGYSSSIDTDTHGLLSLNNTIAFAKNTTSPLRSDPIQESDVRRISTNRTAHYNSKTPYLRNLTLHQSNDTETNGLLPPNNTISTTKNMTSHMRSNTLQESDVIHAITNRTAIKTPYLRNMTLQQSNTSYTCYVGNKTFSLPIFPHFIIVGAQKAGTTAISEILSQSVPNFLRTVRPEAHYWDWLRRPNELSSDQRCESLHQYFRKWNPESVKSNTILFEKTPVLLAMRDIPKVIELILPHKPKIVVILRNPVDRAYSHYKMSWRNSGKKRSTFGSFEYCVKESLNYLRRNKAIQAPPYSNVTTEWNQSDFRTGGALKKYHKDMIARGLYIEQIKSYMEVFPINEMLKVIQYERFLNDKVTVLRDIVKFVGGSSSYEFDEKLLNKDLGPRSKGDWYPPMMNWTKIYLKHLYKPFNDELADLLGESWRDVWN